MSAGPELFMDQKAIGQDEVGNASTERIARNRRLTKIFSRVLSSEGTGFVLSAHDEDEVIVEGGPSATATIHREILTPPPDVDWEFPPGNEGILLRQGVLPEAITTMRQRAYSEGSFRESGGAILGKRYSHGGLNYTVGFCYTPLPEGARRNIVALEFTPESWAHMCRAMDSVNEHYGTDLCLSTWIHCHPPGNTTPSLSDHSVHGTSVWNAIIVGNDPLNKGFVLMPERAQEIAQWRQAGQFSTMSTERNTPSPPIGFVNNVTAGELFLHMDTLTAHELPLNTSMHTVEHGTSGTSTAGSSTDAGDEIQILESSREGAEEGKDLGQQVAEVIRVELEDQPTTDIQTSTSEQVVIQLVLPKEHDEEDLEIVVYPYIEIRIPGVDEPMIIITNIEESNLEQVLRGIRRLVGI